MRVVPTVFPAVTVVVAMPLAFVVAVAGLTLPYAPGMEKVTVTPFAGPAQLPTVAVTVAAPPVKTLVGMTVVVMVDGMGGVLMVTIALSTNGTCTADTVTSPLSLAVRVEVKVPASLVVPIDGNIVAEVGGVCDKITDSPGVGLSQLSMRVVVTTIVWQRRIVAGFMINVSVAGALGRISTSTVPVIVPLIASIVSRAGEVAE